MGIVDRRTFLTATAGVGVATAANGGIIADAAAAGSYANAPADTSLDAQLNAILADYLAEMREERRLSEVYRAAYHQLPAWAQVGPSHLLHDGTKGGPQVGWPELADLPPPPSREGGHALIRMHPREYWSERRFELTTGGECTRDADGTFTMAPIRRLTGAERRKVRLESIAGMRKILARVREQRELKRVIGLPAIGAALDACSKRIDALRGELAEAAVGASPASLAVTALVEATFEASDLVMTLLERTSPHLTGLLRVVVDDFVATIGDGYAATILGTGGLPEVGRVAA